LQESAVNSQNLFSAKMAAP